MSEKYDLVEEAKTALECNQVMRNVDPRDILALHSSIDIAFVREREALLQSLAHLGQAEEAWEAQKSAEAQRNEALNQLDSVKHIRWVLEKRCERLQTKLNDALQQREGLASENDKLKEIVQALADMSDHPTELINRARTVLGET